MSDDLSHVKVELHTRPQWTVDLPTVARTLAEVLRDRELGTPMANTSATVDERRPEVILVGFTMSGMPRYPVLPVVSVAMKLLHRTLEAAGLYDGDRLSEMRILVDHNGPHGEVRVSMPAT